jgi:putative membrane protein
VGPEIIILVLSMCLLGSAAGCFTGLFPGLHVNTLASVMLIGYPSLSVLLSEMAGPGQVPILVSSFIMSAAVVHSFTDFVPSVFIGAPDPDESLATLPGHRLLMEGKGMEAVRAAAIGSAVGAAVSILLAVPLQYLMLNGLADKLDSLTYCVLMFTLSVIVINERGSARKIWAVILILISGTLGAICMHGNIPSGGILGEGTLLFPLLTGLFGMPALLSSSKGAVIPEQTDDVHDPAGFLPAVKGIIMGCLAGWYPGITATAGASIASSLIPENNPAKFISMVASIGTVTTVFSLVTLSVSGSGRSGTVLVVKDIVGDSIYGFCSAEFLLLLLSVAVATVVGYYATIASGKMMGRLAGNVDVTKMNRTVMIIVSLLVLLLTGPYGIFILIISAIIGMIPQSEGMDRIPLTGCLILPTLLSEMGLLEGFMSFM